MQHVGVVCKNECLISERLLEGNRWSMSLACAEQTDKMCEDDEGFSSNSSVGGSNKTTSPQCDCSVAKIRCVDSSNIGKMSLISAIEKLIDSKFVELHRSFEQHVSELDRKNEKFQSDFTQLVISRFDEYAFQHPVSPAKKFPDNSRAKEMSENIGVCGGAIEEKLASISASISELENKRSVDAKALENISENVKDLDQLKVLTPKVASLQKCLDTMSAGESDSNRIMDKLIPMVSTLQKHVGKIDKQQDIDYRRIKAIQQTLKNMQPAMDTTDGKACDTKEISREIIDIISGDIKQISRDVFEKMEDVLRKMSKISQRHERSRSPLADGSEKVRKANGKDRHHNEVKEDMDALKSKLTQIENGMNEMKKGIQKTEEVAKLIKNAVIPNIDSMNRELRNQMKQQHQHKKYDQEIKHEATKEKSTAVTQSGDLTEPRSRRNRNTSKDTTNSGDRAVKRSSTDLSEYRSRKNGNASVT